MKKLKYKKYDPQGNLITHQSSSKYVAITPTGQQIVVPKKITMKPRGDGGKAMNSLPRKDSQNHSKAMLKGKARRKELQELEKSGELWRASQRECLRVMATMTNTELYAYAIQWHVLTETDIYAKFEHTVTEMDIAECDQQEPTMVQIMCLNMMLTAQNDAKLSITIMEMLEGRAVSQTKITEAKESKKESKKVEKNADLDDALAQLKNKIFDKEHSEPEEIVTDTKLPEKKKEEDELTGMDLLASLTNGDE